MMLSLDDGVVTTPTNGTQARIERKVAPGKFRCPKCKLGVVDVQGEICRSCKVKIIEIENRRFAAYLAARQFRRVIAFILLIGAAVLLAGVWLTLYA